MSIMRNNIITPQILIRFFNKTSGRYKSSPILLSCNNKLPIGTELRISDLTPVLIQTLLLLPVVQQPHPGRAVT